MKAAVLVETNSPLVIQEVELDPPKADMWQDWSSEFRNA